MAAMASLICRRTFSAVSSPLAVPCSWLRLAAPLGGKGLAQHGQSTRAWAWRGSASSIAAEGSRVVGAHEARTLYSSDVQLGPLIETAVWRCRVAAGLGSVGFSAVVASLATTASPPVLLFLIAGAAVNNYMFHISCQRMLRSFAMRHVERLSMIGELTSEEVRLEVRTANVTRQLVLTDPAGPWEGSKFLGLVADTRVSFADICSARHLLFVDTAGGKTEHPELLQELLSTSKVISAEVVEPRDDVGAALRLPSGNNSELEHSSLKSIPAEAPAGASTSMPAPAQVIEEMGKKSLFGGGLLLLGGAAFSSGRRRRQQALEGTAEEQDAQTA